MGKSEYVRISKSNVKKMVMLYTLNNYTQEGAAAEVLAGKDLKGMSYAAVARKVFHYLGLDMSSRSGNAFVGITPQIINKIMNSKYLAFPMLVPKNGTLPTVIEFDAELQKSLNNLSPLQKLLGLCKDFLVVFYLYVLTTTKGTTQSMYLLLFLPLLPPALMGWQTKVEDENGERHTFLIQVIGGLIITALFVGIYFLNRK